MSDADRPVVLDCPFCGAAARRKVGAAVEVIECSHCAASMCAAITDDVLAMWNRRVVVSGKPEAPGT